MTDVLKDMQTAPVLTLDPLKEMAVAEQQVRIDGTEEAGAVPSMEESALSEEEQRMADQFAEQIDLTDSSVILQYGAGTQKKMADFSESALENVRTKDLGEIGTLLSSVVSELKQFDEGEEKGFLGFFKKQGNKIQNLKIKYAEAETNIDQICRVLENHQVQLMKDIALLDKMYDLNRTYYKELTMYIVAGKKKLQEVRTGDLQDLITRAQNSGLPEDAQAARDLDAMCERFEKKIHDLELTRMISIQTAPQIRMVQGSDTVMTEKIQSTLVNTIPLWKSQMVLALGVEHSAQAAKAQREVTDMTNQLLRKNAETLKTATVETAKESERGIVDMETLQATNQNLISTLDEVMRIQEEGRRKRREAEAEITRLETELKEKMIQSMTAAR